MGEIQRHRKAAYNVGLPSNKLYCIEVHSLHTPCEAAASRLLTSTVHVHLTCSARM